MSGHRKCAFTHRPVLPKERDGVQIYLAVLNEKGRTTGKSQILDICGSIRRTGEIDAMLYESQMEQ